MEDSLLLSMDRLKDITDVATLRKHYGNITEDEMSLHGGLEAAILTRISVKGF